MGKLILATTKRPWIVVRSSSVTSAAAAHSGTVAELTLSIHCGKQYLPCLPPVTLNSTF